MPFEFYVSDIIPATSNEIFDAWLDSRGHEQLTGGQPAQISADEGANFTAWNGYITGRNLKLDPARRIVQSWRTTKFTKDDPDGHTSYRDGGWQNNYFDPMKKHFGRGN